MTRNLSRRLVWAGVKCAAIVPLLGVVASAYAQEGYQPPDCGINALAIVLTLQGRPATTTAIEAALPARHPEGYSMTELQRAARILGMNLQGERCRFAELPRDRTFIFYTTTHRPGGGHFFTARFVGASKTLIQMIEPPYAPSIIPAERFQIADNPDFLVLKPISFLESIPGWMLAASCVVGAAGVWVLTPWRARRWIVGRSGVV